VLSLDARFRALLTRQRKKRDEAFEGPLPSYDQFLQMRGADAEMTEQLEALSNELKGDDGDEK
jgi:hypothetical protein